VALAPPQARRCWVWRFASTSQARGGAQRRVRHKSTQKLSDKGARLAPYRSSTCPRCSDRSPPTYAKMLSSTLPTLWLMSWSRCRPSSEMSASMLPTLLGDAVATAADLTRRCRRQCCRPSSEMPSSRLPTLLEDVVGRLPTLLEDVVGRLPTILEDVVGRLPTLLEMSSSRLPTLFEDVVEAARSVEGAVVSAVNLTSGCRRRGS